MQKKYRQLDYLHLPSIDNEISQFWNENDIFNKSIQNRKNTKSFVFYEGPPSANARPGIHHVMARTIKDIFCRFQTQNGYLVERKGGWDTHGLPIELEVEKELGITKEDIGKKISIEEYNIKCKERVMRFKDEWDELTRKMGYWVDLDNPYITFNAEYMESLWWCIQQLYQKGYLYKGFTIQPYSPAAGTGLSSHELNQPGTYKDVTDTTIVAMFKAKKESNAILKNIDGDIYFLAWTTTPWTLPSNTALTVGKNIDYVLIDTFNQYTFQPIQVILAKPLLQKVFSSKYVETSDDDVFINFNEKDKQIPFQIIREIKGETLVGTRYEQLLPWAIPCENAENAFQVIDGDFVTTEDGTGIVHTAPTFGADDFKVAQAHNVPPMLVFDENGIKVPLVNLQGKFIHDLQNEGKNFVGKYVKNEYYPQEKTPEKSVDVEIAILLKEQNKAFKVEKYVHTYPHCWRTDKPVLYYPLDSWFIKVTSVKNRLIELNNTINWKPESTGTGRFGKWLENINDWNLSRSRFWGTPLPIWRTEDGKEEKCIGSIQELKNEIQKAKNAGINTAELPAEVDLHKNVVDKIILLSTDGKPMYRESDLIDVWFDSGAMPYAQWNYPK
jgi:isoleucyl-tRNA synthetase